MGDGGATAGQRRLRIIERPRRASVETLQPWALFLFERTERSATVAELATEFLAGLGRDGRLDLDHRSALTRHIVPAFGPLSARDLRAAHIEAWLRSYTAAGYAPLTVRKHLSLLAGLLAYARKTGALDHDPVSAVDPETIPGRQARDPDRSAREMLTLQEVRTILRSGAIRPFNRLFWSVLLLTGARLGEAAGFSWGDWDERRRPLGQLELRQQWHTKLRRFGPTKDKRSRSLPVHPALADLLRRCRAYYARRYGRDPGPDDPLCPMETGTDYTGQRRWTQKTALARWRRDLEVLGLDSHRTVHSTRHTFVSLLINAGAAERPARSLTHAATGGSAYDRYVHLSWEAKCAAVLMLDLGGKTE